MKPESISITSATYWNLVRSGRAGDGALTLYLFYVQKAVDQNTPQPWASDSFCARRLAVGTKSISRWRKTLQELGLIEHIQKNFKGKKYFYVKVNYLTVTITGGALHLGRSMSEAECNTYLALDYYAKWLEGFRESPRFQSDISAECKRPVDQLDIQAAVDLVWGRISEKGYGISQLDTELRFYSYLVAGIANEIQSKKKLKPLRIA